MTWEAWALIVAAVIGALGAVIAAAYDDIVNLLRRPSRNIGGEWEATSYRVDLVRQGGETHKWVGDYIVTLKQTGSRIKGEMIAVKVREGRKLHRYKWKGEIMGDYLIYQCVGAKHPNPFMVSSATLFISPLGDYMLGYFVDNDGIEDAGRTLVGFTELRRRV